MKSAILVILGEREWTQQAIHLSAALAREWRVSVVLVKMLPVTHLEYLGAGVAEALLPQAELVQMQTCTDIVEAYGVSASIRLFEYSDYVGGVVNAAEQFEAAAVFAPAPAGFLPYWTRLRQWWLRRMLPVPLYTLGLGDGPIVWTPPTGTEGGLWSQPKPVTR